MKRWPISPRRVAIFAAILVVVLMMMDFNARLEALNLLKDQETTVRTQATQAMQTQEALRTQVAYAGSDQVVDEWARGEGHYIQNGDQPIVPVGAPGELPSALVSPTPVPTSPANWQIWWNLFFGE